MSSVDLTFEGNGASTADRQSPQSASKAAGGTTAPLPTAQHLRDVWSQQRGVGDAVANHAAFLVSPECVQKYASLPEEKAALQRRLDLAKQKLAEMEKIVLRFGAVPEPVVASDGFTYDRTQIEAYVAECRSKNIPPVSHQTQQELSDRFVPNHSLTRLVTTLRPLVTLPQELQYAGPRSGATSLPAPVALN